MRITRQQLRRLIIEVSHETSPRDIGSALDMTVEEQEFVGEQKRLAKIEARLRVLEDLIAMAPNAERQLGWLIDGYGKNKSDIADLQSELYDLKKLVQDQR